MKDGQVDLAKLVHQDLRSFPPHAAAEGIGRDERNIEHTVRGGNGLGGRAIERLAIIGVVSENGKNSTLRRATAFT